MAAIYVAPKKLDCGAGTLLFEAVVHELKRGEPLVVYLEKGNFHAERFLRATIWPCLATVKMVFKRDEEGRTYV
ncbi:hypothetical protein J26TS2_07100 [Shouchella clausii]|nr:hypothetical protein J26TS2_07100 [Shouchella clausii]